MGKQPHGEGCAWLRVGRRKSALLIGEMERPASLCLRGLPQGQVSSPCLSVSALSRLHGVWRTVLYICLRVGESSMRRDRQDATSAAPQSSILLPEEVLVRWGMSHHV